VCHCARDTVDISSSEGRENFIGNLVVTLWTSSDDDCRNTSQVSNDSPSRDACTAIRIFHETIVARRPNSITKARYISDSLFFYPPVCDEMDAAAFHCAHRRTRYFRETVLRYCARMHVSTMYPSSIFRNIVRYRRVFYISNVYINIRMEDICIYFLQNLFLFSDNSMKFFIVLYTYIRDWKELWNVENTAIGSGIQFRDASFRGSKHHHARIIPLVEGLKRKLPRRAPPSGLSHHVNIRIHLHRTIPTIYTAVFSHPAQQLSPV